jgi:outer membrane protein assembly factor BamE (lipoprotein component of BamABCDE complex)
MMRARLSSKRTHMRPRFAISRRMKTTIPRTLMAVGAALCASAMLSGCVYRMNIQQGNFLEPRALSQLQVGMTRSQVRYLLGTPMVPDAFDKDRWDYLYYKVSKFDNSAAGPMPPAEQREIEPDSKNAKANASS